MNNNNMLEKFQFEEHTVRTIVLDDEPWFVLADVCKVLEITTSVTRTKERIDQQDVSTTHILDSRGHSRKNFIVNESGLYDVILDSRKPQAKAFRRWVTSEVLPTIRKHGVYVTEEVAKEDPADIMAKAILVANEQLEKQKAEIEELIEQREADAPKVEFAEAVHASKESITLTEMSKIIDSTIGDVSVHKLSKALREKGYLFKRPVNKVTLPLKWAVDAGIFEVKETAYWSNVEDRLIPTVQTRVTGSGQSHLLLKFMEWREEEF